MDSNCEVPPNGDPPPGGIGGSLLEKHFQDRWMEVTDKHHCFLLFWLIGWLTVHHASSVSLASEILSGFCLDCWLSAVKSDHLTIPLTQSYLLQQLQQYLESLFLNESKFIAP